MSEGVDVSVKPAVLNMSDEDFLAMGSPEEIQEPAEADQSTSVASADEVAGTVAEDTQTAEPVVTEKPEVVSEDAVDTAPVEPVTQAEVDYKAAYEKLFTPFKANGKEIAVANVDDAISLMQMGANYNKKMAALKPNLKLMKLLENSGLLNEEKIGYLIDLEKKNPEAISKLIKDSGHDPLDLDAEKASGYKPNNYTVDDREIELDTVLDEIQHTPSYTRTLDIVSTKWDGPSKQAIAGSPQLLKVINDHVQSGIYDTILKEVDRERMFGRLDGLSDIEAYRQIGDVIQARGGFNQLAVGSSPVQKQPPTAPAVTAPKPNQVDEDKLKEKRRAAGSTKPAGSSGAVKDYNPLSMSDAEFSKSINNKYL